MSRPSALLVKPRLQRAMFWPISTSARPPSSSNIFLVVQFRLALYTSATRRAVSIVLLEASLDRYFGTIVAGHEVTRPKPDPKGLELARWKLGVRTEEAAYVGDAEVDLACVKSANVLAIQAAWGSASIIIAGNHLVASQPNEVIALIEGANNVVRE